MTDLWEREVLRQTVEFSCSHNTSSGKSSTLNRGVTAEDGAICPCHFLAHEIPKYLLEGYVKKGKIVLRVSQAFENASEKVLKLALAANEITGVLKNLNPCKNHRSFQNVIILRSDFQNTMPTPLPTSQVLLKLSVSPTRLKTPSR